MSIDWITVGAQIVNFLVLIWLLKRFLYRPVLDGIDAREKEISDRMAEAAKIREAAETAEAEHNAQIATLRAGRAGALDEARAAAEAERDALVAETRKRMAREMAEREAQRAEEARRYTAELHRTGAEALLALTRKALSDLADESFEDRIVAHTVTRMGEVADELRAAAGDSHEAVVLTRAPLPPEASERLIREAAKVLPGFKLRFDTDPSLAPGLSLRLGGAQVAWTLDSYLDGLEAVLEDRAGRAVMQGPTDAV